MARHQVKTSTFDSYRRFAGYLADDIGGLAVVDVGAETITAWQSKLLDRYAPFTVLNCRKVCRQAFMEAVKVGLIASSPFGRSATARCGRHAAVHARQPRLVVPLPQDRRGATRRVPLRRTRLSRLWPENGRTMRMFSKAMSSRPIQRLIKCRNFFVSPLMKRSLKVKISDEEFRHYTDVVPTPESREGIAVLPVEIMRSHPWLGELEAAWPRRSPTSRSC